MAARAPKKLGKEARKVWKAVTEDFELGPTELRLLEDTCREIDLIERLEAALEELDDDGNLVHPLVVKGSMGQPTASPLIQELRQHRAVVKTLFAALKLPDADPDEAARNRSTSARAAARARWGT